MSKRNRNRIVSKRHAVMAHNAAYCLALIGAAFVMVILNMMASSSSQALQASIGKSERELTKLGEELEREQTRWEKMKTPEKINEALLRHGLAMRAPHPSQNIRLKSDGKPYAHQASCAALKKRANVVMKEAKRRR